MNIVCLLISLLFAVYYDVRTRKIPNKVTIPSVIFGLVYWIINTSLEGVIFSMWGVLVGFLVFLIPYIAGGMGAGDVKLMMAVGALLGWKLTVVSALLTAIAGGIIALGYITFTKGGNDVRIRFFEIIIVPILKIFYRLTGESKFLSWQSRYDMEKEGITSKYIPYAIPIAIGTILAISGLFQGIINF